MKKIITPILFVFYASLVSARSPVIESSLIFGPQEKHRHGTWFSYPALIHGNDGLLHMTYSHRTGGRMKSIKYVVVNPEKIK